MFSNYIKSIYKSQFHQSDITPEDYLLLNCAHINADTDKIKDSITPGLDWAYIVETAKDHRIAPLVYNNLKNISDNVPSDVIKSHKESYKTTLARNILALQELKTILKTFSESNIRVIVLKGAALAETLYPDIALRPFGDIDLLIHKDDLPKIDNNLSQFGYELRKDISPEFYQKFSIELTYVKDESFALDIHWHIVRLPYSKYVDIEQFWNNATPINIGGIDTLILSPEYLLLMLCLHVTREDYSQFFWLVDISEVIDYYRETFNWKLLLDKIQQYRIHSSMYYILLMVKQLLNAPVPEFVIDKLKTHRASSFEDKIFDILTNPGIIRIKHAIAEFLAIKGTSQKFRFLFPKLFPSKDFLQTKYSGKNNFNTRFLWIGDVFLKGIKAVFQSLTTNKS